MNDVNETAREGDGTTTSTNTIGSTQAKTEEVLGGLEAYLAPLFEKFPHLPENGRKFIVDVSPWVALIFGVLGVLALLGVGGMGTFALVMSAGLAMPAMIHLLISLVSSVLLLMSYPGLKAHTKKGWNLAFYSQVVSVVGGVVGMVMGGIYGGNIVGVVIAALIGFWILFEIRSYYR